MTMGRFEENRTPYSDDELKVENGTQPEEIQQFVRERALDPHQIEGLTVWDFNNHVLNEEALRSQAGDLMYDEYVIPYQASGVWGYMVSLLPERIRQAEILTYSQAGGDYNPYPNYFRHSESTVNDELRREIEEQLEDQL